MKDDLNRRWVKFSSFYRGKNRSVIRALWCSLKQSISRKSTVQNEEVFFEIGKSRMRKTRITHKNEKNSLDLEWKTSWTQFNQNSMNQWRNNNKYQKNRQIVIPKNRNFNECDWSWNLKHCTFMRSITASGHASVARGTWYEPITTERETSFPQKGNFYIAAYRIFWAFLR